MTTLRKTQPTKRGKAASTKHVEELIRSYKNERWIHNTERLGAPDSLSTWYGLDELATFLNLAKEHQADGIKMYYGVYPEGYAEEPAFAGRQTVVLVATRKKETPYGTTNKNIYLTRNGSSEILAFNYGTICPPFCADPTKPTDPNEAGSMGIEMEKTGITIIDHNGEIKIA
jgi:hypothetical protein